MQAKEIKPGAILNYEGAPVLIEKINVQSPSARGASTLYKFRGRNLVTRQKVDFVLKGTESLPPADFHKRAISFMYADADSAHFLDQTDFNQYSLSRDDVAEDLPYITEAVEGMMALIYNDQCVGIQLPAAVQLKITHCDPATRGNSATSRTKPVTLETGLVIQTPDYLEQGEVIKIDTRTGEFLSRA